MFEIRKNSQKIIVAGTGDGWQLIPKTTNATIYCLNDYVFIEKYDVQPDILFIMDVLDEKPQIVSGINNLGDVVDRINKLKVPLIAPFRYEEIPLSRPFPLKECKEKWGIPYFSNTIAYMIAYALLQEAKEIDIYGVNQASSSEFFYERDSVSYWLGIANGLGVKVTINGKKSELLRNKARFGGDILYGYNQNYEEIINLEKKFGEPIVKKLFHASPTSSQSRTIR